MYLGSTVYLLACLQVHASKRYLGPRTFLENTGQDLVPENSLAPGLHFQLGLSTGGRLNKKDGLTRYGNSHVKDKTS